MQYVFVRPIWRKLLAAALLAVPFLEFQYTLHAQVTLAWSRNSDTNIIGYRVYYGRASLLYTNSIDVLNSTNCVVSNLVAGSTYYFAATAYDSYGIESAYSAEVSTTIGSNTAPHISSVTNVAIASGSATPALPFSVWDAQTPAPLLTISGVSDNQSLVKNSSIVLSGTDTNRTVSVTAASGQTGVANITLTVSDGSAIASTAFQVNVRSKPLPPGKLHPKG